MNHEEMQALAFQWRDDELPADRRAEVERHLESCASCRVAVDAWRGIASGLFPIPADPGTEATVQAVMARLPAAGRSGLPAWRWWRDGWVLASLASAALWLVLWGRGFSPALDDGLLTEGVGPVATQEILTEAWRHL